MSEAFIKKHGLLYSPDLHTVLGVDDTSTDFAGRIPYGALSIDDEVFTECPYQSVSIPDSVKSLGNNLFENSKRLETVKLPANITELPPYLFAGCSALYKVTMPSILYEFPEGLFMNCESLPEIPFRAGIKELPKNVISGCKSIKSLVIPNTVEMIGPKAVADCTGLESVVVPESVKEIAEDAFAGCISVHNIRIDGESSEFIIKEDGSLYKRSDSGDILVIKAYGIQSQEVGFFKADVDSEPIEESEDEDFEEDDTFFTTEIGASDDELSSVDALELKDDLIQNEATEKTNKESNIEKDIELKEEDKNMDENNIDSMLADIMNDEKEREETAQAAVSEKETEVLAQTYNVIAENAPKTTSDVAVTNDELEKLFSKQETDEISSHSAEYSMDKKTRILMDAVEFSQKLDFEPAGEVPADPDLFVVAEKTVTDAAGNKAFSPKLISCCKTFARIHDFKHVYLVSGLPLDDEEFSQFYFHYISKKNVVLACEAESPAKLSDYGKKICELSRISLNKDELNEQRKRITVKTDTLIKLVIRDKYEA